MKMQGKTIVSMTSVTTIIRVLPKENPKKINYTVPETDEANQMTLKRLASYVPKLVVRRLYNNPNNVVTPEMEFYQACVVFADVSGFTPLTEKMASLGPEGRHFWGSSKI